MVLSAVNESETVLELLRPVGGSQPGDRVFLEGTVGANENPGIFNANKFKKVAAVLKTNSEKIACFNNIKLITQKGAVSVPTLSNGQIS